MRKTISSKPATTTTAIGLAIALATGLLVGCPKLTSQEASVHQIIEKNPYLKQEVTTQLKEDSRDYRELFSSASEGQLLAQDLGTIEDFDNPEVEWIFSPDRHAAIAINATTREPDNSLDIYNRQANEHVERLNFCGTPCEYIGAYWLDNEHFAFVQLVESYPEDSGEQDGYVLVVSEYDLSNDTVANYQSSRLGKNPPLQRKQAASELYLP